MWPKKTPPNSFVEGNYDDRWTTMTWAWEDEPVWDDEPDCDDEMGGKWQTVMNLPPCGLMVLVRGDLHAGVALACCDASGRWDVQPYKGAWYYTKTGVTH